MPVITTDISPIADRVVRRHERMRGARVNWERHWEELARFIMPNKDDIYNSRVSGEKRGNRIYTGMPIRTNELLAAALHSRLTNPSSQWFGLKIGDPKIDKLPSVKTWMQEVTRIIINTLNQTNFTTQIHEVYLDLGCFGTALLLIEEDDENILNFLSRPIFMAYVDENSKGVIDTVSFERKMKLRQIKQEFGEDVLTEELLLELKNPGTEEKEYTIIHLVEPREDADPEKEGTKNMRFSSVHVLKELRILLKESGFNEMPYVVPRWSKISGEVYGRSPGMTALPDIKMLNAMKLAVIKGAQKIVDPPLQAPDDGVLLPLKTAPGAINYYRAGSKDRIESIVSGARPDLGEKILQTVVEDIEKAFFIDQLQVSEIDRQTATEFTRREDTNLRKLGPTVSRQYFELLKPMINRIFSILQKRDMFPDPPSVLAGMTFQVEYTSQIAKAQRTADSDDFTRVMGLIAPMVQAKPAALDWFDEDFIVKDLSEKFGLPVEYIRREEAVKQLREQQAQANQEADELEEAQQVTEVAKTASQIGG